MRIFFDTKKKFSNISKKLKKSLSSDVDVPLNKCRSALAIAFGYGSEHELIENIGKGYQTELSSVTDDNILKITTKLCDHLNKNADIKTRLAKNQMADTIKSLFNPSWKNEDPQ